nr:GNAT family N-acetyltransferase [Robertkochia sp. 3YJGBD-33]
MLVGYYTYCTTDTGIKLENFFIDPRCINQGYGKEMLTHFLQRISESSASKIYLEADPHAESFYHKFGFKTVGSVPSSIPGRSLPIMELKIGEIPRKLT